MLPIITISWLQVTSSYLLMEFILSMFLLMIELNWDTISMTKEKAEKTNIMVHRLHRCWCLTLKVSSWLKRLNLSPVPQITNIFFANIRHQHRCRLDHSIFSLVIGTYKYDLRLHSQTGISEIQNYHHPDAVGQRRFMKKGEKIYLETVMSRDERTRTRIERTLVFVRVRPNMNEHEHGFFKNYWTRTNTNSEKS